MKEINFRREVYIKDLFNSKEVLYFFNPIEFETFDTFLRCYKMGLIQVKCDREIIIPLETEFEIIESFATKSSFFEDGNVNLLMFPKVLEEIEKDCKELWNKKFSITLLDFPKIDFKGLLETSHDSIREWIQNNMIAIRVLITGDNYKETIQKMVKTFRDQHFRFFNVEIDYMSFMEMKFKDFQEVEFWLNHLSMWRNQEHPRNIVLRSYGNFVKRIFVSDDLKLYLDGSKNESSFIFDLAKNIGKNGEEVDTKELNYLRQYVDLTLDHLRLSTSSNFVNFKDNILINGSINEVPWITKMFLSILK